MKKKIIIWSIVAVVVVLLGVLVVSSMRNAAESMTPVTSTTTLKYGKLTSAINTSGTVSSEESYDVYSTLNYLVKNVYVEEGQLVEAGAVLAQLDTESLQLDILQQEVALENSETGSEVDISTKLRAYQNAQERSNLDVSNKTRSYELYASQVKNGTYPELVSAQTQVDNTKTDYDNKKTSYNDNKILYDLGDLSEQTLDQSRIAFESAERAYKTAVESQQATIKRLNDDVETQRKSLDSAKVSSRQEVDNARKTYENAKTTASTESLEITLEKLEKQLNDSTITAPISGTVTKVYAKEGAPGNGLMFIIEDLDRLEISTKVKEYDAGNVVPGLAVVIKSDATGETEIAGLVKSIAPTSEKNNAGQTITANVVEYAAVVTVAEKDSGLKIGMNTRMNIILEEKENVFSVPYDAVIEDGNGGFMMFTADETAGGKATLRSVPVTPGLETDFALEVSGDGLTEGMLIISDPADAYEGAEVKIR